jgi:hypothetical protein
MDGRLQAVEANATETNALLGRMDGRLQAVENNGIEANLRLRGVEGRLAELHDDFLAVRADTSTIKADMGSIRGEAGKELVQLRERVARLEAAVFKPAAE